MRALLSLALLLGCGPSGSASGGDSDESESTPASSTGAPSGGGSASLPIDPTEAPTVVVRADPAAAEGAAVSLLVESRGEGPARLRPGVKVERRQGEDWVAVEGRTLLRGSCDEAPTECLELVPGAELRAVPWQARVGAGQCECAGECSAVPAGQYRFVVESCAPEGHRPHQIASAAFTLDR